MNTSDDDSDDHTDVGGGDDTGTGDPDGILAVKE